MQPVKTYSIGKKIKKFVFLLEKMKLQFQNLV